MDIFVPMRSEHITRLLAGVLLALFASVAVTLPIHLSSVDHIEGACSSTTSSSDGVGCLFLQFLTQSFAEGEGTPSVAAPAPCERIIETWSSALCTLAVPALPALRAPPFLSIA